MARVIDAPLTAFTNHAMPNPAQDPHAFTNAFLDQIMAHCLSLQICIRSQMPLAFAVIRS